MIVNNIKVHASTLHYATGEKIILPLYDEVSIKKTERKKIQILVSGKYKKGIFNNEKSFLYQHARNFFDKNGFSFGIEISITKNIPGEIGVSGFREETGYEEFLDFVLQKFNSEKCNLVETLHATSLLNPATSLLTSKTPLLTTPDQNISIILFPKYKLPENFLEQSINYRKIQNFSVQDFILESFYEVRKKSLELEERKKNPNIKNNISDFGFIGNTVNIWIQN